METSEKPKVTLTFVDSFSVTRKEYQAIQMDIEFCHHFDYEDNFKEMAKNISDYTLIEILKARDTDYIAEGYQ